MVNRIPICQAHAQIPSSHTQNIQGSNRQCPGRVMRVGRLTSGKKITSNQNLKIYKDGEQLFIVIFCCAYYQGRALVYLKFGSLFYQGDVILPVIL